MSWSSPRALAAVAVLAVACTAAPGAAPSASSTTAAVGGECPTTQPAALPAGETRTVTIDTDHGLDRPSRSRPISRPIAAGNFVALAGCGFYDGVVFHRVVPGFVIQGGDPDGTGTGGPGYTIQDEAVTAEYGRGVVAMARTRQPNSVGSQFFIVLDDAAQGALSSYNTYQIIGRRVSTAWRPRTRSQPCPTADAEQPSSHPVR